MIFDFILIPDFGDMRVNFLISDSIMESIQKNQFKVISFSHKILNSKFNTFRYIKRLGLLDY
jgi:hypothetical protein